MEDGGIREGGYFSLSLENETLLGRKSLEKELTHSSACDKTLPWCCFSGHRELGLPASQAG